MGEIKFIASDLDGTLLNGRGELLSDDAAAISEMCERGILFVPTTGRALYEIPSEVRDHPAIKYIISSNGAVINDLRTAERHEALIDGERVKKIHELIRKYDAFPSHHKYGCGLVDADMMSEDALDKHGIREYYRCLFREHARALSDYDSHFTSGDGAEMLVGFFNDEAAMDECEREILELGGVIATRSTSGVIEVISDKAGKRLAIERFAALVGADSSEYVTVGDNFNDIGMLSLTPNSLAVANAKDEVKAAAGHIICSNDEGVARYILDKLSEQA
jgi:Cof subfamily protein (haloacid dehalogenase superfamily)